MTAYPWRNLAFTYGHDGLKKIVREHGWTTMKTDRGTVVIAAQCVHAYYKDKRGIPSFECPPMKADPRWHTMIDEELRRLVPEYQKAIRSPEIRVTFAGR